MTSILNILRTTFAFLVLITVVVAVHEFAHLLTALAFGATVNSFSIGFGPELFGFDAGGIHWQVSAIPLGGYVSFPLEAGPGIVMVDSLSTAAQMVIMLSGVVMNALLAAAITFILRAKYKGDTEQYTMEVSRTGFLIWPFIKGAGATFKAGQRYFWWFVASTSIDLMLFNVLFIFPLDGGKVWMLLLNDVLGLTLNSWVVIISGVILSLFFLQPLVVRLCRGLLNYVQFADVVNEKIETKRFEERMEQRRIEREESDRRWKQTCADLGIDPNNLDGSDFNLPPRK